MKVSFVYKTGKVVQMAESHARILAMLGHGYLKTDAGVELAVSPEKKKRGRRPSVKGAA